MEFPLAETEGRDSTWNRPALRPELYTCHLYEMILTKSTELLQANSLEEKFFEGKFFLEHKSLKVHYISSYEIW